MTIGWDNVAFETWAGRVLFTTGITAEDKAIGLQVKDMLTSTIFDADRYLPHGKGWFCWPLENLEENNVLLVANLALEAGLGHVIIKIADGNESYPFDWQECIDLPALVTALHGLGIQVWGYQYVYLFSPVAEADIAIDRIEELNLDGLIVDAEGEAKGKPGEATAYMTRLRTRKPNLSIGLSSYRYPHLHPELPWRQFREQCDFDMPQVYWLQAHNPAAQLEASYDEFKALIPRLPYIPTGSAWYNRTWQATPADVNAFMDEVITLGCPAFNFWVWENCRRYLPDVWQAVADYPFGEEMPPPDPEPEPIPEPEPEDEMNLAKISEYLGVIQGQIQLIRAELVGITPEPEPEPEPEPTPDPIPVETAMYQVTEDKAIAHYITGYNDAEPPGPYPIMLMIPVAERTVQPYKNVTGQTVKVKRARVNADGPVDFFEIFGYLRQGKPLYLSNADGKLID